MIKLDNSREYLTLEWLIQSKNLYEYNTKLGEPMTMCSSIRFIGSYKSIDSRLSTLLKALGYKVRYYQKSNTPIYQDWWHKVLIPEFNPNFFCIPKDRLWDPSNTGKSIYNRLWWDIEDTESRLKAFDALIDLYKSRYKETVDISLWDYFHKPDYGDLPLKKDTLLTF